MEKALFLIVTVVVCAVTVLTTAQVAESQQSVGVIVVDVQGDFTTWKNGSLAVNGTDKAFVDKLQVATEMLSKKGHPVYATQDWHPKDHISFFSNHKNKKPLETVKIGERTQILWPPHCVQDTENAKILIDNGLFRAIVKKGKDPKFDSYSGFQDDGGAKTEMDEILKKDGIKEVIVYGIAADYCVKATAIDAANAGYKVTVIDDLTARIAPDTAEKAYKEMKDKGITVKKSLDL